MQGEVQIEESHEEDEVPEISKWESILWLSVLTAWISILSAYLVDAIQVFGASSFFSLVDLGGNLEVFVITFWSFQGHYGPI